jgi:uncharacterized protein involved in exopolysaccharide biosynthesis
LLPEYTEEFQEVQTVRKQISEAQQDLIMELRKQSERTATSISMLEAQRGNLATALDKYQERMRRLGPQAVRYERFQKDLKAAIERYNDENKKYLDSVRAGNLAKDPMLVSIVDNPTHPNPNDPRRPILWLNILIACIGGLVLALVYAFLADHFDHTIKSVDDAERYLGAPVLASVPKLGRRIIRTR